jgi:hypothetical protein
MLKFHKTFHDEELALEEVPLDSSERAHPDLVIWDNEDPRNPLNISPKRKMGDFLCDRALTFCVSFTSSVFSTTVFVTAVEFNVNAEVMLLGLSLYVLGFAFGPLIFGALSKMYGAAYLFGLVCLASCSSKYLLQQPQISLQSSNAGLPAASSARCLLPYSEACVLTFSQRENEVSPAWYSQPALSSDLLRVL